MKEHTSAYYAATLAQGLSMDNLLLIDRSDRWWDMFWYFMGLYEAQSIKEKLS